MEDVPELTEQHGDILLAQGMTVHYMCVYCIV